MEKTSNKKRYGIIAAVLVALLVAGVGTWAWLQATDTKTNEFTVGNISKPDVKPDPDNPDQPGTPGKDDTDPKVDGYLFETHWTDKSKMVPGTDITKNPNVGIGKDSDSSYVFIYVKNAIVKSGTSLDKTPYFELKNTKWKPVAGEFKTNKSDNSGTQYVSGLFMYTAGTDNLAKLTPADGKAAYTDELFNTVHIPDGMNNTDVVEANTDTKQAPTMTVSCYIFGADQGDANNAITQAKAWADTQA